MRGLIKIPKKINLLIVCSSLVLFFVIAIPTLIINSEEIKDNDSNNQIVEEENKYVEVNGSSTVKVYISKEDKIVELPLEDYIVSVVSGEMPAEFENEALKAQAIAARTYLAAKKIRKCSNGKGADVCDSTHCQVYISKDARLALWKENGERYWSKLQEAVNSTVGQVLTYDNELVMYPQFFSTSSGKTENAVDVFSNDVPYLQAIESPGEEVSTKYVSSKAISIEELVDTINRSYPNAKITKENLADNMKILSRSESGGVKEIQLGDEKIKGTDFRFLIKINSTNFEYEINDKEVIFKCKGYGHGVGMSQWGANVMAKEKKDFKEILSHYYTGVEIKELRFK